MNTIILLLSVTIPIILYSVFYSKINLKTLKIRDNEYKAGSILTAIITIVLIAIYIIRLFALNGFATQIAIFHTPTELELIQNPYYVSIIYSSGSMLCLALLRWFSLLMIGTVIVDPLFKKRESHDFIAFIVPLILLLNFITFNWNCKIMFGTTDRGNWHIILYGLELVLLSFLCFQRILFVIKNKDIKNLKHRLGKVAVFMLFYMMAYMPTYLPQLLFGETGGSSSDFSITHRLLLYGSIIFIFLCYSAFNKKPKEERRYLLTNLAISGFIAYFSYNAFRTSIASYPLHLCNTAIVLMVFAFVFNMKGVFYFTYLVNVLGSMCALLMPSVSNQFFTQDIICFWYNHIYDFVLPILGVMLGVFKRPTLKLMGKAIIIFTVYVVFAGIMNAWLNNDLAINPTGIGHTNVDYFFLYSDFFVDKFSWMKHIKYDFIWDVNVLGVELRFYYMYILTIYSIFIGLMFAMWGVYGSLYRIHDSYAELLRRKKLIKIDELNLMKAMGGRSKKERLRPEGEDMIKINHFSKTYDGSTRKAVDDFNLEVHKGEVMGFIGHNGAGKSTTIKCLVGIQSITEGSIEVEGYDIAKQPLEAKLNIGYVSDNHAVYEKLTGREYIYYVADLFLVKKEDRDRLFKKYVNIFKMENSIDDQIKSYSHGMKQKLVVIAALVHNPKIWVLDEPLTGLDPTSAYLIKKCMREHADNGNIVFFSSHVIEVVEKICDRIAIISDGKLRQVSTMKEINESGKTLEEIYLQYIEDFNKDINVNE
jgi:ABC-2 type transport system ATP-binding protein